MHKLKRNVTWVGCGNVLFVDGHVQRFEANLPLAIQRQRLATNRLAVSLRLSKCQPVPCEQGRILRFSYLVRAEPLAS